MTFVILPTPPAPAPGTSPQHIPNPSVSGLYIWFLFSLMPRG